MEKGLSWQDMYLGKCNELVNLKKEVRILEAILKSYLPIVEKKSENGSINN